MAEPLPPATAHPSDEAPDDQATVTNDIPEQQTSTPRSGVPAPQLENGGHDEPATTELERHIDPASSSVPPPAGPVNLSHTDDSKAGSDDAPTDDKDSETPRLVPGAFPENIHDDLLPEPAIPSSGSSFVETDKDVKRMSISSIYSMASARGIPSSAASANGSDAGSAGNTRSVSGLMGSSTGKPGEIGVSNVNITTGTHGSAGGNLALREQLHNAPDALKRSSTQPPRSDPSGQPRTQPIRDRDRSRAKRRLSGSTAASSHSPSSDRVPHHREKEEGQSIPPSRSRPRL